MLALFSCLLTFTEVLRSYIGPELAAQKACPQRLGKTAMACLAFLLLLAPCLVSQSTPATERPAMSAQRDTVYVTAEGKFESAPDTAQIQFNISAQDKSSEAAYARASRAAESMRQVLRANQVDVKTAEVGFYSLEPVYDWSNAKRKLVGYRVNTQVSVRVKDFVKAGMLMEQLAAVEDTENQSLSYLLQDIDAAKVKAIEDAFNRARLEAAALARAGGRSLGDLSYASIDTSEPVRMPPPTPMRMAAMNAGQAQTAPTAEFSAAKTTVNAHVAASFQLR